MGGIGAVSPLRRFAPALPEGEPRVRRVSMDGGMQFRMRDRCGGSIGGAVGGIGAVSPLRRFAPALPEGEPRMRWVSVDGGRAKGAVGVGGRWESQGLGGCRWTEGGARVRW